jgi:hypothetical protein
MAFRPSSLITGLLVRNEWLKQTVNRKQIRNIIKKQINMVTQVLKTVLAGILAGVLIFMMPFLIIKVLIFFLLIKAIFRLMGGGRYRRQWHYAYAHKYHHMSEEDRKAFIQKYGNRCGWSYKSGEEHCGADENKNKTTNV